MDRACLSLAHDRIRWLVVIAHDLSVTCKGQAIDVKRIGRELGFATCSTVRCRRRVARHALPPNSSTHSPARISGLTPRKCLRPPGQHILNRCSASLAKQRKLSGHAVNVPVPGGIRRNNGGQNCKNEMQLNFRDTATAARPYPATGPRLPRRRRRSQS